MKRSYTIAIAVITITDFSHSFAAEQTTDVSAPPSVSVEIDWFAEFLNGGNTAIALAFLVLMMIGIMVERMLRLRPSVICPHGLVQDILPRWAKEDFDGIAAACKKSPSILAEMAHYIVEHRKADPALLIPGAADISMRELRVHSYKNLSLAVVASLAPLLGLLGTMIGMIESFKLVEIYGDAGGASMLAGSISKALITTAIGLIIAIPSLGLYHLFKFKVNALSVQLEKEFELLINSWLLKDQDEESKKTE